MSRVVEIVLVLAILWIFGQFALWALRATPSFDGGMHCNTAVSFSRGEGYGYKYTLFFPFPHQTDGPVILPAAAIFPLFGVTPFTTQAVNLFYLAGFLVLVFAFVRRLAGHRIWGLAAVAAVLSTPGVFRFGLNGFGEIPTFFFALLGLLLLMRALKRPERAVLWLFLGGVALGLCLITKAIGALMAASIVLVFVLIQWAGSRCFRSVGLMTLGLCIPVAGWEVFRLLQLGSLQAYGTWWHLQAIQLVSRSGAGASISDPLRHMGKLPAHLELLASMAGVPTAMLLAFLIVPLVAAGAAAFMRRPIEQDRLCAVGSLMVLSSAYFVWWLLISPAQITWLRYILNGFIAQQCLAIIAVAEIVRVATGIRYAALTRISASAIAVILISAVVMTAARGEAHARSFRNEDRTLAELSLVEKLRELPADAVIFGFDWWKAPVLALFSDRKIENFNQWDPAALNTVSAKYLVLDQYALRSARQGFGEIRSRADLKLLYENAGGAIYEISEVRPYAPFDAEMRDPLRLSQAFTASGGDLRAARGLYNVRGEWAWTKPEFAILLRRSRETRLVLTVSVDPLLLHSGGALLLHASAPDCLETTVPLKTPGSQKVSLALSCPPSEDPRALEAAFRLNRHMPFPRQADMDGRRRGLMLQGFRLEN